MRVRFSLIGLVLFLSAVPGASAATRVVTFGGGSAPANDQTSLLSNAEYFDRVRQRLGVGTAPYDVFFADGGAGNVVKSRVRGNEEQEVIDSLGNLLYGTEGADLRYRRVDLPNVAGAATQANLEKWFDSTAAKLQPGDHLLFYFTGHGGPDPDRRSSPRNTRLFLWGGSNGYSVQQFAAQLDKLDPQVETTLIMVQCYSGGFANIIYKEGDPAKGFSDHLRAGFFSTSATRMAAGCTEEIDAEDYHEFSTSFFEALCGQSRTGKTVERADYDHDGKVSYVEAFSYAILHSPTIDIPMDTSDQLLRDKSRFHQDGKTDDLLPRNAPWSQVLAAASPTQKIVLEQLSEQLALSGEDRLAAASTLADQLFNEMRPARGRRRRTTGDNAPPAATRPATTRPAWQPILSDYMREAARARLQKALASRYPELTVPFNPDAIATIDSKWREIGGFLKQQPDYQPYVDSLKSGMDADNAREQTELKWVQVQRLLERANTVILAANLHKVADDGTLKVYHTLVGLEGETLQN